MSALPNNQGYPLHSTGASNQSVLARIPVEIWELILSLCVHVNSPPGYVIQPPYQYAPMQHGRGMFTLAPFEPPHMHWDGLRSPITCAYMRKLAAVHTRRRLSHVSRGFREVVQRLPVWRTQVEWLCLPMDMDSRRAIITLAEEYPFGRVGRLVKRLEFSSGAGDAGIPVGWNKKADEGLMRRIIGHCAELEEMWCGIEVKGLVEAVVLSSPKTIRVFSYTGQHMTTGDVYSLLAHCPTLQVLRFTYLAAPPAPAVPAMDESPFLQYGDLPPLALHTLCLSLTDSVDPLLGWMSNLRLPCLRYLKIERDFRRPNPPPGGDAVPNDVVALPWPPPAVPTGAPGPGPVVPAYLLPWHPAHIAAANTQHNPVGPEPPLPLGLGSFIQSHGSSITTLEVLETIDPLLLLPSMGWALLAHCANAVEFITSLPGSAYGIATRPRPHAKVKRVGCYGFWLDKKGPGDEEEGRRTRVHLENVLDAVINLIGGDLMSLDCLRFFDVQKARVGKTYRTQDASGGNIHARVPASSPMQPARALPTADELPLPGAIHPAFLPNAWPPSDRPLGWPPHDEESDRPRPEYTRTLKTIRELCAANGVKFEDVQGELVDCWAGKREMWMGSRGLA